MKKLPDGAVKKTVKEGERIKDDDRQINILTIIANQSYEQFASELQQEYVDDCGVVFTKLSVQDSKNERTVTYRYDAFTDPNYQKIDYQVVEKVDEWSAGVLEQPN